MGNEPRVVKSRGNSIVNSGAIIAVLLGIWCVPLGIYGFIGVITGKKVVAGLLGAAWAYMAIVGTYELVRRKFNRDRGRKYADRHLLAGTVAVSTGLIISGAVHETMPALAIVPALSAIQQANDGHAGKKFSWIHAAVLAAGIGVGIWFYRDGVIGDAILQKIVAMP
jgi:hypothetical protein